jgi:hypothetical protein
LRERRGSLTVWVTPEAIAAWVPATTGRRGRLRDYSDVAIDDAEASFGRPWRQTEGLLGSNPGPAWPGVAGSGARQGQRSYRTTFSRRSVDLGVATALRKTKGPAYVVIDSTGLKVVGAGDWLHEKHGGKPRRT